MANEDSLLIRFDHFSSLKMKKLCVLAASLFFTIPAISNASETEVAEDYGLVLQSLNSKDAYLPELVAFMNDLLRLA
jgi:hypothetical protein